MQNISQAAGNNLGARKDVDAQWKRRRPSLAPLVLRCVRTAKFTLCPLHRNVVRLVPPWGKRLELTHHKQSMSCVGRTSSRRSGPPVVDVPRAEQFPIDCPTHQHNNNPQFSSLGEQSILTFSNRSELKYSSNKIRGAIDRAQSPREKSAIELQVDFIRVILWVGKSARSVQRGSPVHQLTSSFGSFRQ